MRKVVLFIAMSLDGYIADGNGGVAWLNGHGNDNENIDTYTEFTKDIDTVLMGWNTSHQVVTELSPQEWVYNKFTTYVLTHKECNSSQQIHFTSENPVLLLERLKQEAGKDIWICGGANLVQQLVSKNMIDKYMLIGFLGLLLYQQFQNIGMLIGLLPITGITLPFLSYGGSSMLSYMVAIGIIMNASRKAKKLSDYVYE